MNGYQRAEIPNALVSYQGGMRPFEAKIEVVEDSPSMCYGPGTETNIRARLLLLWLSGPSSRSVARKLRKAKIYGQPGDPYFCPVAKFIRQAMPWAYIQVVGDHLNVGATKIFMPPSVIDFVEEFDDLGRWKKLRGGIA